MATLRWAATCPLMEPSTMEATNSLQCLTLIQEMQRTLRQSLMKLLLVQQLMLVCSLRLTATTMTSLPFRAQTWLWVKASRPTLATLLTTPKQSLMKLQLALQQTLACSLKLTATTRTSLTTHRLSLMKLQLALQQTLVCNLKLTATIRTFLTTLATLQTTHKLFLTTHLTSLRMQVLLLQTMVTSQTTHKLSLTRLLPAQTLMLVCSHRLIATTRTLLTTLLTLTIMNSASQLLLPTWASLRQLLVLLTTFQLTQATTAPITSVLTTTWLQRTWLWTLL